MEHESFENEAIAAVLNEQFVAIKVDREERPDVDRVYMTFVQATTGSGGWPMSVWLTPELKPFYGGTYFPPEVEMGTARLRRHPAGSRARLEGRARQGRRVGRRADRRGSARWSRRRRRRTCPGVAALDEDRPAVSRRLRSAPRRLRRRAEISATVRAAVPAARARAHGDAAVARRWCCARCARWRWAACAITSAAVFIATRWTREWRVPHFEKMLYDQAQLVLAYRRSVAGVRRSVLPRGGRGHAALRACAR